MPVRLVLTSWRSPIARRGVSIVASLVAGDLLVAALHRRHARCVGLRADEVRLHGALRTAPVVAQHVVVVALFVDGENAIAAHPDLSSPSTTTGKALGGIAR